MADRQPEWRILGSRASTTAGDSKNLKYPQQDSHENSMSQEKTGENQLQPIIRTASCTAEAKIAYDPRLRFIIEAWESVDEEAKEIAHSILARSRRA